jgi:diguanylate cyclase (GGDEF)-like protein/PAS domain S-box-containing protein
MNNQSDQEVRLRRKLDRERRAREEAEALLETRSKELFEGSLWLQEAASRLSTSESHLRAVLNAAQEAIITFDERGLIYEANRAAEVLFHFEANEMVGLRMQPLIPELREGLEALLQRCHEPDGHDILAFEVMGLSASADRLPISLSLREIPPIPGEGQRYVALITDRRRELALERQLNQISTQASLQLFDQNEPLVLPKRGHLEERFLSEQRAAQSAARSIFAAVLCINIDRFKRVNDLLSFDAGDRIITRLGANLQGIVRTLAQPLQWDVTTVRLEGDEFAVLLLSPTPFQEIEGWVRRLRAQFAQPLESHGQRFVFSLSAGCALGTLGDDVSDLLIRADRAMRVAKQRGGNAFRLEEMSHGATRTGKSVEHNIILGLERKQFAPFFQPKVSLQHGEIVGFEALMRWPHPERGLIPLGEFLPTLEVSSLMLDVGLQLFEQVIRVAKAWDAAGIAVPISFNVSNGELLSQTYRTELLRIFQSAKIPSGRIVLEITESVIANLGLTGEEIFASLQQNGFKLSIDDFGVGSSSLSRLRGMPVQELKIDRSFVTGIEHSSRDLELLSGVIQLGRSLGLDVVLEGVESEAQIQIIRPFGDLAIQGFYYSKAVPAREAQMLLHAQPWRNCNQSR